MLFASGVALATAALANDSTASTGGGGLVLERTDAIDLASEELFVSAAQIRIHYVFRNRTASDVETIVAFPMPDRDLGEEYGGDVGYPSGFRTTIAGKPVRITLERKAVVKDKDYTALLSRLGIAIAPDDIGEATKAMDRLSPAMKRQLVALGIAGDEEYSDGPGPMRHHLIPLWTVRDKYWWRQRFPAGEELVVDHRYVPGVGGSVDTEVAFKQFRKTEDSKQAIAYYCMDREFIAAVDRRSGKDAAVGPQMPDTRIDYILTTGANWARPIADFRLIVDKGKPGNLVSFCETGIRKISPTRFEVRHKHWKPISDLHVLIIEPRH
ncbi:MAG TPA: DUF4424 family protein [Sphingomicrobium sp.]|nr:DUF4424 family protein [Sphingomicrobium sp.]